jgi:hypothetical protein
MRFEDCFARVFASVFGGGDQRATMSSVTAVAATRTRRRSSASISKIAVRIGASLVVGELVAGVFVLVAARRCTHCAQALPEGLRGRC